MNQQVKCLCECCLCSSIDVYRSQVSNAIKAFDIHRNLITMPEHLIAYLPPGFLSTFAASSVNYGWQKLPLHSMMSADVMKCRSCTRHYTYRSTSTTDFDGPNPLVKNCKLCIDECSKK